MPGGRRGFSTGACAAAAAKAAALAAAGRVVPDLLDIPFPDGRRRALPIAWAEPGRAAVRKDAGDDPDITDGVLVRVEVARDSAWRFEAGEGVGMVTLPGLQVPPGEPAINPAPRAMIRAALEELGWTGARIRVAIPGGEALAARTFNPRLGVAGGLSILGTQGRVRPFSLEAVRVTIDCGLDVTRAAGHDRVGLVPGHLGERALRAWTDTLPVVEVSNEWGHALDAAAAKGFRALLLAGHPGKLAKLAEGCFNTHSARSPSPLPRVRALAEALTGRPAAASPTLEGLFQALDPAERRRLAEHLAGNVAQAARRRTGLPCAVLLTTMAAGVYGGCTEGTPWA
jgi:cobalt-precorrin-5B (C1)-methyltransferase